MPSQTLALPLHCSPEQAQRLTQLQQTFAKACSWVAGVARAHRCWNRVALHHLSYRGVRERFPELGAQMACNAVYSVCKACRWAYQHPSSPFTRAAAAGEPLPLLGFLIDAPVYFDRHTLNVTPGKLSMYTLDGRLHFKLGLTAADEQRFRAQKLKETALVRSARGFELVFWFESAEAMPPSSSPLTRLESRPSSILGPYQTAPSFLEPQAQAA